MSTEAREKPSYWAVLPADVRYDNSLPPAVKIMYAEISSLQEKEGYCWASNSYFARLYDVSIETVSRWVAKLQKAGHIEVEIDKAAGNRRYITLLIKKSRPPLTKKSIGLLTKSSRGIDKKVKTPIDEKVKHNTKAKNNEELTISQRSRKKDLALAKQKAVLEFGEAVENICEREVPLMPAERVTWYHYRAHLAKLGTDWLKKGTKKLRELTTWQDSDPKRTTTDLKKAFGAWMVRVAGYRKKDIA